MRLGRACAMESRLRQAAAHHLATDRLAPDRLATPPPEATRRPLRNKLSSRQPPHLPPSLPPSHAGSTAVAVRTVLPHTRFGLYCRTRGSDCIAAHANQHRGTHLVTAADPSLGNSQQHHGLVVHNVLLLLGCRRRGAARVTGHASPESIAICN